MASKPNYSDVVKRNISTRKKFTMNFHETFRHLNWTEFRNIAVEIQNHVKKIGLNLKLDDVTYGDGACFIVAVMQQLLRPDVKIYLPDDILRIVTDFDIMAFRRRVATFMLNSKNPSVLNYKLRYEKIAMPIIKKSWTAYWNFMMERFTWADSHFVQGTAYMLGLDIWIVTTKSKSSNPYTKSLADMSDPQNPSIAPPLILGLKGDCHYQSLLHLEEDIHPHVTYADVVKEKTSLVQEKKNAKENSSPKMDHFKQIVAKANVKETGTSVKDKNIKYDEKAASGNDKEEEEWIKVVSKKRKNVIKKTFNTKVITSALHYLIIST